MILETSRNGKTFLTVLIGASDICYNRVPSGSWQIETPGSYMMPDCRVFIVLMQRDRSFCVQVEQPASGIFQLETESMSIVVDAFLQDWLGIRDTPSPFCHDCQITCTDETTVSGADSGETDLEITAMVPRNAEPIV